MLDSAIPGVSSLVIHISDPSPRGLHHQPDNNSNDLTQIINILLHSAAVNTAHWPATFIMAELSQLSICSFEKSFNKTCSVLT